jgi:ribonuclease HI
LAVNTAIRYATARPATTIFIKGDSRYVISQVLNGRIEQYTARTAKGTFNAPLWAEAASALSKLQTMCPVHIAWTPRHLNREADELLNAHLDSRPPNPNITSDTPLHQSTITSSTVSSQTCSTDLPEPYEPFPPHSSLPLLPHFTTYSADTPTK